MKKLSSSEVRQMYLDFFASKGHKIEPSASLVPVDDPTLLWINSGVATLKKYFDGTIIPENPRLANAQKSIRTNDIENVGKTARHHTLFEMLGNFSIGDYFKEDAITWAWELLTSPKWFDMEPEKLYMTVNPKDEKAKEVWLSLGIPESHIIPLEDNFWDIGAGPSGPNTEIFYDRGQAFNDVAEDDPENFPGGENERYLEIWNIVFSEFNHNPDNTYTPLPKKNIDTGMGLERVLSLFQDAPTNFETDLFLPIIEATVAMSDHKKYAANKEDDISFKVIADHVRAVSFAIGDGALPSNEGRGYILRRLLRRAVMHGKKLGIHEAFMYKLVPVVGNIMASYYPEINEQSEFIQKVVRTEEERFHETINDGLTILSELIAALKKAAKDTIEGKDIFKLYDTYGFPVELTEEFAEDNGLKVDHEGFEAEMQGQKDRARAARSDEKSMGVQTGLLADVKVKSEFTGYTNVAEKAKLEVIVHRDALVAEVAAGEEARFIFNKTPFYAEMGGQIADKGVIKNVDGAIVAEVTNVQKAPNGQPLHFVNVLSPIQKDEKYELEVNDTYRHKVIKNHTATHLLHRALKDVLGEHANQAGSLVTDKGLRFDFTHFGQVTAVELAEMERIVNEKIWAALAVETIETDVETAKGMGAMALFGEKYGKVVRVVNIGGYSIELCGGVHVRNTSEIGIFKLISESGIGAGVRRIEAVTSQEAYLYLHEEENNLKAVAALVKAPQTKDTQSKVAAVQQELKELQKENDSLQAKFANDQVGAILGQVTETNGVRHIAVQVDVKDMNQLRQIADQWKQQDASDILVLATASEGKVNLLAAVNEATIAKGYQAGDLIKTIAPSIGGGGGGRSDMAQAGGKNPAGLPDALKAVAVWIAEK